MLPFLVSKCLFRDKNYLVLVQQLCRSSNNIHVRNLNLFLLQPLYFSLSVMELSRRKSTSLSQLDLLIKFMEKHTVFAKGTRSKEGQVVASRLWEECAEILNAEGVFRTPKQWAKYWNDYKCRVRAKQAEINKAGMPTRGRTIRASKLTPFEERVITLLGEDARGERTKSIPVLTPLEARVAVLLQKHEADKSSPSGKSSTAPDISTVKVEAVRVAEEENKVTGIEESVEQPADAATRPLELEEPVRPKNQGPRRIRRRVRYRYLSSSTRELKAIRAILEDIRERMDGMMSYEERRVESITSIAGSFEIMATSVERISSNFMPRT